MTARWVSTGLLLCLGAPVLRAEPGAADRAPALSSAFLREVRLAGVSLGDSALERRLLSEYGAMFVARPEGLSLPPVVLFRSQEALESYQLSVPRSTVRLAGVTLELQTAAARAIESAARDATGRGLRLTSLGGSVAARRGYRQSLVLWRRRVDRALSHWTRQGDLSAASAERIRDAPLREQMELILEEEARGHWFSLGLDRSILRSAAPPGASQHSALLALDVHEHSDAAIRQVLARHGWFQTVIDDLPHFTYLGREPDELPALGLVARREGDRVYWVPAAAKP